MLDIVNVAEIPTKPIARWFIGQYDIETESPYMIATIKLPLVCDIAVKTLSDNPTVAVIDFMIHQWKSSFMVHVQKDYQVDVLLNWVLCRVLTGVLNTALSEVREVASKKKYWLN